VGVEGDCGDSTVADCVASVDSDVGKGVLNPACRLTKSRTSLSMIVVRTYVPRHIGLSCVLVFRCTSRNRSKLHRWLHQDVMLPEGLAQLLCFKLLESDHLLLDSVSLDQRHIAVHQLKKPSLNSHRCVHPKTTAHITNSTKHRPQLHNLTHLG